MAIRERISSAYGSDLPIRTMDQWLETNGLGGYACASLSGVRQLPSHGMLVVARNPPIDRYVLLAGLDIEVRIGDEIIPLTTHLKEGERLEPDARRRVAGFKTSPWPTWTWDLGKGRVLQMEVVVRQGTNQFVYSWMVEASPEPLTLQVRPMMAGRPMNSAKKKLGSLKLKPKQPGPRHFVWKLRPGCPSLALLTDGAFEAEPHWREGFLYENHSTEDLAYPGVFTWQMKSRGRAWMIASTADELEGDHHTAYEVAHLGRTIQTAERTRRKLFRSELDRNANAYVVSGSEGRTLLSSFPRGTEMGAEAMIAMRGICLSPGRLDTAQEVLHTWRKRLSLGLLPAEISEHRQSASWDSAEPSLWFVIAVYEYFRAAYRQGRVLPEDEIHALESSVLHVVQSMYRRRHKAVGMDEDGLILELRKQRGIKEPIRVKRVEVQALWINALWICARLDRLWEDSYQKARSRFEQAFWSEESGYLLDEVSPDPRHVGSRTDGHEQILAVGGLPLVCVDEIRASLIVSGMEDRYPFPRAIQQMECVPWLFGPFVEAWFRVRHQEPDVLAEMKRRFLEPWEHHLLRGGIQHLPEYVPPDATPSQRSRMRRAFFSSVHTAELLRILYLPDLGRNEHPFDDTLDAPIHLK